MLSFVLLNAIGVSFLFLSYQVSSDAFLRRYDQLGGTAAPWTGFSIECLRLFLASFLTSLCLISGFREELMEMFWFKKSVGRFLGLNKSHWLRLAYAAVAFVLVWRESHKAFSTDKSSFTYEVMSWAWTFDSLEESRLVEEYRSASVAYFWYMFYSAVFWGVIVPALVAIPLVRLFPDLKSLWRQGQVILRAPSISESSESLRNYASQISSRVRRYLDLLGALAAFEVYQILIGNLTLSTSAQTASRFAVIICSLSMACIVGAWYLYFTAWQHVIDIEGREDDLEMTTIKPAELIRNLVRRRLSGYAIGVLVVVSAPLKVIVGELVTTFSG